MPDPPHVQDGYNAISSRRYKGKSQYDAGFPWSGDAGVLAIDGTLDERLLIWEFVIDTWRESTLIVPGNVTIHWADDGDPFEVTVSGHGHFAAVTNGTPGDAHIWLNRRYLKPDGADFDSIQFTWESIAHEYGHVILLNADESAIEAIPPLFGKTMDDWRTGVWETSVEEAWVETFKDWTLAKPARRKYDNRTQLRIPRERWFHVPGEDETGIPGYPGIENVWDSEIQLVWENVVGVQYEQRSFTQRIFPFPPLYPYEKIGPPKVPSTMSAGGGTSGSVEVDV